MKWVKKTNIEFASIIPALVDIAPPVPAGQMIPEWFQKLPLDLQQPDHKPFPIMTSMIKDLNLHTIKKCPAVVDYFTEGYIIPFWMDMLIQRHGDEFSYETNFTDEGVGSTVEFHDEQQFSTYPFERNDYRRAVKFTSPWFFWTPPGWSTLFLAPQMHPNKDFTLIPGIVETDTFHQVNFPSIWHAEGERLIKRGTPFLHVIPFKREKKNLIVNKWEDRHDIAIRDESFKLRSKMTGGYRQINKNRFQ
tara:strand:- start:3412 stop:4155 length:744 start_codon:yes stop_codon:yes gene_type:complete